MSRRRDLGSMFDEDGPGESPAPSEPAKRPAVVDEPLLNDEARQMLEERTRAAKEAAGRAAGVAAEKSKELGKAALGAFGKWREDRKRRSDEAATAKAELAAQRVAQVKQQPKAPLEDVPPVEVAEALEDSPPRAGYDTTFEATMDASLVYDAMGSPPAEEDPFDYVDDMPAPPITGPDEPVLEANKKRKPWILIAGGIGGAVLLAAAVAYYFMRPAPAPVAAPTSAIETPAPVEAPAPVVTPDAVPTAPVEEMPEPVQPAIDFSEPVPEVAPASPVSYGAPVQAKPAPIEVAPKPAPVSKPVRKSSPAPVAPRAKRTGRAPAPAPEPQKEQRQIDQIRDFGKQLESLGGG